MTKLGKNDNNQLYFVICSCLALFLLFLQLENSQWNFHLQKYEDCSQYAFVAKRQA